jgi:ABC-type transporter Mla MlaB component
MNLTVVSDTPELVRLTCSGDISQTGLRPGTEPLVDLLGPGAYARRVIVNLEPSTFIDSGGVSMLIVWQKRFLRDGGRIVFYQIPPLIKQVLDLLNLRQVLNLASDEATAVAMVQGGGK